MPVDIITFLEQYRALLAPGSVFLSTVVGATIALRSIAVQRRIARQRASLDIIIRTESEQHYIDSYLFFLKIREEAGWEDLFREGHQSDLNKICDFLNHYEVTSISILTGILDEDMFKEWQCSSFIKHYKDSLFFVYKMREECPKDYEAFEALALKWMCEIESKERGIQGYFAKKRLYEELKSEAIEKAKIAPLPITDKESENEQWKADSNQDGRTVDNIHRWRPGNKRLGTKSLRSSSSHRNRSRH